MNVQNTSYPRETNIFLDKFEVGFANGVSKLLTVFKNNQEETKTHKSDSINYK